jgi:ABC-2 type transport system permease protein
VRLRDISHIWDVAIQAGFYLTPILYPLSVIQNSDIQKLLLLNPLAQAVQDAREVLVTKTTIAPRDVFSNPFLIAIPYLIVLITLSLGLLYFKKHARTFAEDI